MGQDPAAADDGSSHALLASLILLAASLATTSPGPAHAQAEPPGCAPAVARLVALQGAVEVQRADSETWVRVTRLDTSLCAGDRLRTGALSRAGLHVVPETIVRVDQNTVITLNHSAEEIAVEFFVAELAARAANTQSCGAGYFITRFPKKFKVRTPHMNAAVEGTEFMVETSCDATRLTVLEGAVASETVSSGERKRVEAGQSLASGAAGAGPITTVVRPADAVQWVLRFPPISDRSLSGAVAGVEECATRAAGDVAGCQAAHAERLLRAGGIDEALSAIDVALATDVDNSDAHALRSVIQIAKNDLDAAVESAERATSKNAANYRAWLALSHVQQARFDLGAALASARRAQSLEAGSSIAHARVAELLLSLGDSRRAEQAARAAVGSDPTQSASHSVLGFVHLARIDTRAARADFQSAIERDSFAPLPRLGLGLVMIREGDLVGGREQIEIAVALDPSNSLLRSYVGKAYYEENTRARDELAAVELRNAKTLDGQDPTPHLYDAIRLQAANQPVAALQEIKTSIALNDNRAVFRSRLKLDEDLAVRGASQGRIYSDLGFGTLAVLEGWRSVDHDPGDFSGHRLLADTYAAIPRHEVARVNELFMSQLLQPLNLTPLPPQLGEANLFILDTAGPSEVSFNEFSPMFLSNGWNVHASGTVGGNDTWGNDVALAAISGRWSVSLGQFHFETEGFRANNDLEQDIYSAYVQFRGSERTSMLAELKSTEREQGDLKLLFNPDNFSPDQRVHEESDSLRLGMHHEFSPDSQLQASFVYQDATPATSVPGLIELSGQIDSYIAELQHIYRGERWRTISGLRHSIRDEFEQTALTVVLPFPPFLVEETFTEDFEFNSTSAYLYAHFDATDELTLTAGASADWLEGRVVDEDQVNPKFGLVWRPSAGLQMRLAAMRTMQPDTYSRQDIPPRLEPTQLAGFNQLFAGTQGEGEWRYGLGIDGALSDDVFLGAELSQRDIQVPFVSFDSPNGLETFGVREVSARTYINWMAGPRTALSASYRFDRVDNEGFAALVNGATELRTHRLPVSARYFHPSGLTAEVSATYVDQDGDFLETMPQPPFELRYSDGDRFLTTSMAVSYRLPRRRGMVTIAAHNLLDEQFRFQDVDPENPEIYPERLISVRFTVAFR